MAKLGLLMLLLLLLLLLLIFMLIASFIFLGVNIVRN